MQNFTLGKKGISMLFFAFFLLIGSSPTFGQTCPTVSNTNPDDFCYLDDIADLTLKSGAVASTDGLRWYRTANSTNPIPNDEFLGTGTYYAGNSSGSCVNRIAVTVTVTNIGAPVAEFGNFFQPCEYDADDTSTVQDLIDNVTATNTSYTIEVFDEEYGTTALDPATPLISDDNMSYFIGQRDPNASPNCPSSRIAVSYDPVLAEAPTGDAVQTFCAGATVADLEASFTSPNGTAIRWYSTEVSQPRLSATTPLINGEFYYASQIVNRQNSSLPPCESTERFEVRVVLEVVQTNENTQSFCVDSEDASTTPTVEDLISPFGNPFFADEEFTQLLSPSTSLVDGEDYFTASGDENDCQIEKVIVQFVEIPNAGADVNETVCSTELDNPNALIAEFTALLAGRDLGGEFTNKDLQQLAAQYTQSPFGIFTTTYTVTNGNCEDFAILTVTVQEATPADAGTIDDFQLCQSEESTNLYTFLGLDPNDRGIFTDENDDVIADGNFTPSAVDDFPITYTVSADNEGTSCVVGSDSEDFTITVVAQEVANAGGNQTEEFCEDEDEDIDPSTFLGPDAIQGGTFVLNGEDITTFNPATRGPGEYEITYTVTGDCITGTDAATITVTVIAQQEAEGGENRNDLVFCSNEADIELSQFLVNAMAGGIFSGQGVTDNMFNPSTTGAGDFTIIYTVTDDADCVIAGSSDTATFEITVLEPTEANAGRNTTRNFCVSQDENISLLSLIDPTANMFGTFKLNGEGEEITSFNPSEQGTGFFQVIYTIEGADNCAIGTDTAEININVSPVLPANAGGDQTPEVCVNENQTIALTSLLGENANVFGTFVLDGEEVSSFNPSELGVGEYEFTYTVTEDDCATGTDQALITLTVKALENANAGEDRNDLVFCVNDDDVNLSELLINAMAGGTFSGTGVTNGMFSPSSTGDGDFTITYTVTDEANCVIEGSSDTAIFEITVLEPTEASAGDNQTPDAYCVTDDQDKELVSLLGDGANPFGTFTIDGEEITSFNPAELGAGEFVFTYSIDENDCAIGTDSATITVKVTATPDTPVADANQSFCLINNPTVADIVATGENVKIYLDEALNDEATGTNPLADTEVYYAAATNNGCKSDGVKITISLTNGTVPTLQTDGNEFCRSDNPTVQDLINNLSGSGIKIYQASTGGTALATSTSLVDGTTYFASGTDAAGCESSERRPLQVEVAFCGIPEAFSPNGDNINDRFVIPDIATDFPNYTIEIFNRWGNVVFKGNSSTGDWDGVSNQSGTLGDNVLAAGVYFYILNYNDGQTAPIQGKVYLSR